MQIKSHTVQVNASPKEVFDFLKDTRNIHHLMPLDKISEWQADELTCSFKVQGGITISFEQTGTEEPTRIFLKSGKRAPFPFNLTVFIEAEGQYSNGYLLFDAEVNMFLKMMIEGPLTHLFNSMAEKLKEHYQS